MLTQAEFKILSKIGESHIISQGELSRKLDEEGLQNAVSSIVKSLLQKEYITTVSPIGPKCFAITRSGIQALNR
jgi:DNA-binding MarR family transcriptional regulator